MYEYATQEHEFQLRNQQNNDERGSDYNVQAEVTSRPIYLQECTVKKETAFFQSRRQKLLWGYIWKPLTDLII